MGWLVDLMDSLKLEDGESDLEARKAELDQLVRCLTKSEARRLRLQLNAIDIPCDICVDLPSELILCIVSHLELEDLTQARLVSRTWNATFSSPEICIRIIKLHFRANWERYYKDLDTKGHLAEGKALGQWLGQAIKGRIRRSRGFYHSMSIYHHDRRTRQVLGYKSNYSNGRVATKLDSYSFLVRSLSTGLTTVFVEENRMDMLKWVLSDQFLVGEIQGSSTLVAWRLDSTQDEIPQRVRLPSKVRQISASKDRVGIITTSGEVLIWCIGKSLREVENSKIVDTVKDSIMWDGLVAFHPNDLNQFFVMHISSPDITDDEVLQTRFIVQEFYELGLVSTYTAEIRHSQNHLSIPKISVLHDGMIGGISKVQGDICSTTGQKIKIPVGNYFTSFVFDIYRKELDFNFHRFPDSITMTDNLGGILLWRDQLLAPVFDNSLNTNDAPEGKRNSICHQFKITAVTLFTTNFSRLTLRLGVTDMVLTAVNPFDQTRRVSPPPWYGRDGPGDKTMYFAPEAGQDAQNSVAFHWIAEADFAKQARLNNDGNHGRVVSIYDRRFVQGDDDFVVMFGRYRYVVWCFNKEVKLPIRDSTLDPHLHPPPLHPLVG